MKPHAFLRASTLRYLCVIENAILLVIGAILFVSLNAVMQRLTATPSSADVVSVLICVQCLEEKGSLMCEYPTPSRSSKEVLLQLLTTK